MPRDSKGVVPRRAKVDHVYCDFYFIFTADSTGFSLKRQFECIAARVALWSCLPAATSRQHRMHALLSDLGSSLISHKAPGLPCLRHCTRAGYFMRQIILRQCTWLRNRHRHSSLGFSICNARHHKKAPLPAKSKGQAWSFCSRSRARGCQC